MNFKEFAQLIKNRRLELDLKGRDIAAMLGETDDFRVYLSRIETGKEIPSPKLIRKLASVLGIDEKLLIDKAIQCKKEEYAEIIENKYNE